MRAVVRGVLLLLALLVVVAQAGSAQSGGGKGGSAQTNAAGGGEGDEEGEAGCKVCFDCFHTGGLTGPSCASHSFSTQSCGSPGPMGNDSYCMDCAAFNACHTGPQELGCRDRHWYCGLSHASIESLRKALDRQDHIQLASFIKRAPKKFSVSPSGYFIVRDCDGAVVSARLLPAAKRAKILASAGSVVPSVGLRG